MKPWAIGILKPKEITSFDVIRHFKRQLPKEHIKKIGHLGTLDPFADGVLVITACGGSRIQDFSHQFLTKTYRAKGVIGKKMNTGDLTGEVVEENDLCSLNKLQNINWNEQFQKFALKFYQEYWQKIPQFSASKVDGKPMYQLAREGKTIDKPPKQRWISRIEFHGFENGRLDFSVTCSGGTYIRQLFEDMCEELGLFGYLEGLTRTAVGHIRENDCHQLETITADSFADLKKIQINKFLPFQSIQVNAEELSYLKNGQPIDLTGDASSHFVESYCVNESRLRWALDENSEIQALLEKRADRYWPKINF